MSSPNALVQPLPLAHDRCYNRAMKSLFSRSRTFFSQPIAFGALLGGVALIVRSLFLTKASVWHDEGYSAMIINYPPGDIIARTMHDVHPPLYYLLLSGWQAIFGSGIISLRGFSVVCGVATVVLLYALLRRLFSSETIAKTGATLAAIGPFLVRYSEEMRMYSLAALIAVGATYAFVHAVQQKQQSWSWWIAYGALLAAGLYTQYFIILIVPAHLLYLWALKGENWRSAKQLLAHKGLWIGAITGIALFAPWLPAMFAQVTRVSGGFWIPPIDWFSIPNALSSFITYDHRITEWLGISFTIGLVWASLTLARQKKVLRPAVWLLLGWIFIPMILVTLLSLRNPVFMDRYFVFVTPALYALIGVLYCSYTSRWKNWQRLVAGVGIVWLLLIGISVVGNSAAHQMGGAGALVNREYQPGDMIISAELYTFFDFSYYNHTGQPVHLLSPEPFGQYGEWSLIHDKETELRVAKLSDINAPRVWLVGKTGERDYFGKDVPSSWRVVTEFRGGDTVVRLYETN